MFDICAAIKQHNTTWYIKPTDYNSIYERMMVVTDGDHEISADAASWCELACLGEVYEFREGIIRIEEIEQYV